MTKQILRDYWCEDAMQGDRFPPSFWRAMAKFDKALTDRGLRPVRIVQAERGTTGGSVHFDIAVECETGRGMVPFWKWWLVQEVCFTEPARREQISA